MDLASHAERLVDMGGAEDAALLETLAEFVTQWQFVYAHRWRVHDLVMWDNRRPMHRGTEYEERRWQRHMGRASVSDIGNTFERMDAREERRVAIDPILSPGEAETFIDERIGHFGLGRVAPGECRSDRRVGVARALGRPRAPHARASEVV